MINILKYSVGNCDKKDNNFNIHFKKKDDTR